jgi:pyruvate dehydrogenase phosphatase
MLKKTFEMFDKALLDDLYSVLPKDFETLSDVELKKIINDQATGGKVYSTVIRCMRGSTAIVSLLDPNRINLWVANLGDCQACKHYNLFPLANMFNNKSN